MSTKKTHRKNIENDGDETRQTTPASSGDGGGLGPQPSASAATEPEPVRDASGTGGASGGLNSSVNGVAGSALDRAPHALPKRNAARAPARQK